MHTDLSAQGYTQTLDIHTIYEGLHILNHIAAYVYLTNGCNIYTVWKQPLYSFFKHPAMEEQLRLSRDLTCLPENFGQV